MWLPNSPNLNPVNYAVWNVLQKNSLSILTIHDSQPAEAGKLPQRLDNCAIGQWRRRLECVVQQQGGHIKHLTKKSARYNFLDNN